MLALGTKLGADGVVVLRGPRRDGTRSRTTRSRRVNFPTSSLTAVRQDMGRIITVRRGDAGDGWL
jgi:hypothetical protein